MLLITNGLLHTMENDAPLRADILIDKGKIIEIKNKIIPTYETEIFDLPALRQYCGHDPG